MLLTVDSSTDGRWSWSRGAGGRNEDFWWLCGKFTEQVGVLVLRASKLGLLVTQQLAVVTCSLAEFSFLKLAKASFTVSLAPSPAPTRPVLPCRLPSVVALFSVTIYAAW